MFKVLGSRIAFAVNAAASSRVTKLAALHQDSITQQERTFYTYLDSIIMHMAGGAPVHCEIWKYGQSTSKVKASVLQNLVVQ